MSEHVITTKPSLIKESDIVYIGYRDWEDYCAGCNKCKNIARKPCYCN